MIIYQFFNQDFLLSEVINCGQLDKTRHHFTQPPSKPHICHTKNRLKPSFRLQPVVCLQNHQYHVINLSVVGSCNHHPHHDRFIHLSAPATIIGNLPLLHHAVTLHNEPDILHCLSSLNGGVVLPWLHRDTDAAGGNIRIPGLVNRDVSGEIQSLTPV